jgi:NAD-dependent DNA ligase
MNKSIIKKNYLKDLDYFNKLNEAYYNNNKPIVQDYEYDILKKKLLVLEKDYPFLKITDLPL